MRKRINPASKVCMNFVSEQLNGQTRQLEYEREKLDNLLLFFKSNFERLDQRERDNLRYKIFLQTEIVGENQRLFNEMLIAKSKLMISQNGGRQIFKHELQRIN